MGLETFTYINSLDTSNPGGTDDRSQGDDHIRGLKTALKNTFNPGGASPAVGLTGAVTTTHTELNILDGATLTTAELNVLDGATAGTAVASKALVVDASKDIDLDTGDLSCTNITASGTATVTGNVTGSADITGNALKWGSNTVGTNAVGTRTVSTSAPSGGSNGDVWYRV